MSMSQHIRSGIRLLFTGQWRLLHWMANLHLRGVDLGFVSGEQLGYTESRYGHHSITAGPELRKVLSQLDIRNTNSVIDIGCGKGSALFTLAEFPFAKVAGCEYSPELLEIAVANLRRVGLTNVEVFQCDATQFDEFDEYSHLFLANPFSSEGFEKLMMNLGKSLQRAPRPLTIIYRNPKSGYVFERAEYFDKTLEFDYGGLPYAIYEHRPEAAPISGRVDAASRSRPTSRPVKTSKKERS